MISPMTPPGTRVVCIRTLGAEEVLTLGQVYVVERMELLSYAIHAGTGAIHRNVVAVQVRGVMCPICGNHLATCDRAAFDYAALPETLTKQLDAKPVDIPGLVSVP